MIKNCKECNHQRHRQKVKKSVDPVTLKLILEYEPYECPFKQWMDEFPSVKKEEDPFVLWTRVKSHFITAEGKYESKKGWTSHGPVPSTVTKTPKRQIPCQECGEKRHRAIFSKCAFQDWVQSNPMIKRIGKESDMDAKRRVWSELHPNPAVKDPNPE